MGFCKVCGYEKKHLCKCSDCKNEVCFLCFVASDGLCTDCFIKAYNLKYRESITDYALGIPR